MSARVLVVDDVEVNRKLLHAKLAHEYFEVTEAVDGFDALEKARAEEGQVQILSMLESVGLGTTATSEGVTYAEVLTKNGWDTGDEHGPDPWGNVHFRNKGPLGPRLSAAAMNIFRFLGDLSHIVSFIILLHKIVKGKSAAVIDFFVFLKG